jgi:hypothetical protein
MNIPDHISESLETLFVLFKILKFFDANPDLGSGFFLILDPCSGMEKFGSGINIAYPQHWLDTAFKIAALWIPGIGTLFLIRFSSPSDPGSGPELFVEDPYSSVPT